MTNLVGASLGGFNLSMGKAMETYLELAERLGLNAVEILFERLDDRASLWAWEAGGDVRRFIKNFEISGAHLPFVYLNPISPNPKIIELSITQLKEAISKASEMGMNYAVMHARGLDLGLSHQEELERWGELFDCLASYAKQNSIILTIENADSLWNLQDIIKLLNDIDSDYLRMTLDIGHAHMRKVPPLQTFPVKELTLRALDTVLPLFIKRNMPYEAYGSLKNFLKFQRKWVYCLHIHDYNGKQDHLPLGRGKIDFSFLSELKDFRGPYILEARFQNPIHDLAKDYSKLTELIG